MAAKLTLVNLSLDTLGGARHGAGQAASVELTFPRKASKLLGQGRGDFVLVADQEPGTF